MLANIVAPSSAPPPAQGAADSRAACGGENGAFADTLNSAMQMSAPVNGTAAATAPHAPHGANQAVAAQQDGDAAMLADKPAVLAALQEVPSPIAPTSTMVVGEPAGEEQAEPLDPEQEQPSPDGVVFPQIVDLRAAPPLPPPAQAAAATGQQVGPVQANGMEVAEAGAKPQAKSPVEVPASQITPEAKGAAGAGATVEGVQAAFPADAAMERKPEVNDTRAVAPSTGGATADAAIPLPGAAGLAAAAPAAPPADLRGYAGAVAPPPPARQISPAVLSLSAQSGTGNAPSRLVVALRPDDLGRVEIAVEQAPDAPAEIRLSADRPETLRMLMRDTDAIQALLQQAGVGTENGRNLSFSLSDGGSNGQPSRERESRPQHQQRHLGQRDDALGQSLAAKVERSLPLGRIDLAL